jgi:uncharacterized membrane protein
MDLMTILMRLLHIVLGVFWVGAMMFNVIFVIPSIRDAGPDGAKVAAGLMRRRFMDVMPVAAIITILAGLWLYWKMSAGFQSAYVHSATGGTLAVGGLLAIVAFIIGVTTMRPAMLKAAALSQSAAQAPPAEREAIMARAQALRARAFNVSRWVVLLITLTAVSMAVARYL